MAGSLDRAYVMPVPIARSAAGSGRREPGKMPGVGYYTGPERATVRTLRLELESLRVEWQRLGAPIAGALAPGITPEEIDALAEPFGLRVPTELKALWEWHNGVQPTEGPDADLTIGPGGYYFFSDQQALKSYEQNRLIHAEPPAPDLLAADMYWHASWLPFMEQGPQRLYVDCDRRVSAHPGAAPIRLVSWEWEAYDVDIASSLAEAVRTWTWLLSQDFYQVVDEGSRRRWDVDYMSVPLFLRGSGLV
jgi:cell wall assembly regulator SMI1